MISACVVTNGATLPATITVPSAAEAGSLFFMPALKLVVVGVVTLEETSACLVVVQAVVLVGAVVIDPPELSAFGRSSTFSSSNSFTLSEKSSTLWKLNFRKPSGTDQIAVLM